MPNLERAIQIAVKGHSGQIDKAGQPYILHPLRVMLRMGDNTKRIVAVLHDVVEDTSVTLDDLRQAGFSIEEIEAVDALTKRPGETRLQAAARAACNPIAYEVKLADNADNMDLSRIASPTDKDQARMAEYQLVRELLQSALDEFQQETPGQSNLAPNPR